MFSKFPIGFNDFQIVCFKMFSKSLIGFSGFQIVCFQNEYQSVFKILHRFHLENTQFENTLKHIIWKPLKPMRNFENTLKDIIWKHFETHYLKTLWNTSFENTLKPMGDFWKHFETHYLKTYNLKTIETYGRFLKHFETHNLKTLWNT